MKLFVQARKNGYKILYPKVAPYEFHEFAGDIRPSGDEKFILGRFIYTIAFTNGGCIYTKHIIVHDIKRSDLGNIGFSVFIPSINQLSGIHVISLLDELMNTYCRAYCPDYCLGDKIEDWSIFEAIKTKYEQYLIPNDTISNYQQGIADPAYIYYTNNVELCKFFDAPYQEEYTEFKQVFFVEKKLQDKPENPLEALRHEPNANLTNVVDLENPEYTLIYKNPVRGGIKIEVKVNNNVRQGTIKKNEVLEITWSKEHFGEMNKSGKWDKIGNKYLIIDHDKKEITVRDLNLDPIEYNFTVETKGPDSKPINNTEISIKCNGKILQSAISNGSQYTFSLTAEQIQNRCYIRAKQVQENLRAEEREIRMDNRHQNIILYLSKIHDQRKTIPIVNDKTAMYCIVIDERKGKRTFNGIKIKEATNKLPQQFQCDARYGYKFIRFDFVDKPKYHYKAHYEAVFEELWYRKIPKSAWVFFMMAMLVSSYFLLHNKRVPPPVQDPKQQISDEVIAYVEGIELNKNILDSLKTMYCVNIENVPTKKIVKKDLWDKIFKFSRDDESNTINEQIDVKDFCAKIDNAILFRNNINLGEIDNLKGYDYTALQQKLKNAIDSIQPIYKTEIKKLLKVWHVSKMDLNEIADTIISTQKSKILAAAVLEAKITDDKGEVVGKPTGGTGKAEGVEVDFESEFLKLFRTSNDKEAYKNLRFRYKNKIRDKYEGKKLLDRILDNWEIIKDIEQSDKDGAKSINNVRDLIEAKIKEK
jgi:hypothetical protein